MINEKGPQFNTVERGSSSVEISPSYSESAAETPVSQSERIPVSESGLQKTLPVNTPSSIKENGKVESIDLSNANASDSTVWGELIDSKKQGADIPS